MRTFSIIDTDDGHSFVSVTNGTAPAFRVDIVTDDGSRSPCGEFSDIGEANELADWFGREGDLRAEVVEIGGEA